MPGQPLTEEEKERRLGNHRIDLDPVKPCFACGQGSEHCFTISETRGLMPARRSVASMIHVCETCMFEWMKPILKRKDIASLKDKPARIKRSDK